MTMILFAKMHPASVRIMVSCSLLFVSLSARAELVATFSKPLYQGMTLEFQLSNLTTPRALKGKGECEASGRMMVLVLAYDPNSPLSASPYAAGCWHATGSMVVVNAKVSVNSAPLDLSFPISKAVTKADFAAWPRYKIDRARSNPPEKIAVAVVEKKAQLDLSPEAIAYSSSETMLGVIQAIQLLDKESTSAHCRVQGNVKLALRTESAVAGGTVTDEGSEVCWYIDAEDKVNINGYVASAKNTFRQVVKKSDLSLTSAFTAWPEPCRTNVAAERFRCKYAPPARR
ncbi:hypothetical protein [Janthinobacterium tructae]